MGPPGEDFSANGRSGDTLSPPQHSLMRSTLPGATHDVNRPNAGEGGGWVAVGNVYSGAPSGLFSMTCEDVAPAPLADFPLPLSPGSLCFSLTSPLLTPRTHQACLRALPLVFPLCRRVFRQISNNSLFLSCLLRHHISVSDLTFPYTMHPPLPAARWYTLVLLHFL